MIGQAGAGTADGVQGFGGGTFSGVAGFGGDNAGTGVFGLGGAMGGQGVRGIGAGGSNTIPTRLVCTVKLGAATLTVCKAGAAEASRVWRDSATRRMTSARVFSASAEEDGPGVRGIAGAAQNKQSPTGSGVGVYGNGDTGVVGESLDPFEVGAQGWGLVGLIGRNAFPLEPRSLVFAQIIRVTRSLIPMRELSSVMSLSTGISSNGHQVGGRAVSRRITPAALLPGEPGELV